MRGRPAGRASIISQTLLPAASCALFTGLLALPAEQLRMAGVRLVFLDELKLLLSIGSVGWCGYLGFRIARLRQQSMAGAIGSAGRVSVAALVVALASMGLSP